MTAETGFVLCACGCGKTTPSRRARYHDAKCRNRAKMRRHRRRKAALRPKPPPLPTGERLDRISLPTAGERSADGLGTPRRGKVYEELVADERLRQALLTGRMTQRLVAEEIGTSVVEVNRAYAAIKQDVDRERARAQHEVPAEALASLADLGAFRARYFQVPNAREHVLRGQAFKAPEFQRRWAARIEHAIDTGGKLQILAPPRHGKTEMLIQFVIQQILKRPNIRVMWVGGEEDQAKEALSSVRDHLEHNERLITDFLGPGGSFKPPSRSGVPWRDERLTVSTRTVRGVKSPTLRAVGKGGNILSRDVDLVIVDDIVNHKSTRQPATRKADADWFATQLMSRLEPHTAAVVIGSRQHPQDLYGTNLRKAGWEHIVETAHDRARCAGEPHVECVLFHELRPYSWLYGEGGPRDQLGDLFDMVYLNKPRSEGAAIFDEAQVKACRNPARVLGMRNLPPDVGKRVRLVAGMDPAASGYQASFLVAYDAVQRKRWMVDLRNDLAGGIQGARQVVREFHELYRCTLWVVEANSQQSVWLQDEELRSYCAQHGIVTRPHYTNATNKWDEHHGVSTLAGLFREKMIDLPYGDAEARAKVDTYVEQLLDWTGEPKQHWRRRSDLVMASWFPETTIRAWAMQEIQQAEVQYEASEYPVEWMEVA